MSKYNECEKSSYESVATYGSDNTTYQLSFAGHVLNLLEQVACVVLREQRGGKGICVVGNRKHGTILEGLAKVSNFIDLVVREKIVLDRGQVV